MSNTVEASLDLKPQHVPDAPQYGIRDLLSLTFLTAGISGAWTGSFWAFALGMFGFMFLLTRAMRHPRRPAMRVADADSEAEAARIRDSLASHGFSVAITRDRSNNHPETNWHVVVSAIQARAALERLVGTHSPGTVLPEFANPRCVFLADDEPQASTAAGWLSSQGIPAFCSCRSSNLFGSASMLINNVPVFVENLADAELAIDRIARQLDSGADDAVRLHDFGHQDQV